MLKYKACVCINTEKLEKFFPYQVQTIVVKNVLFELAKILKNIILCRHRLSRYNVKTSIKKKYKSVKFGNNVLVGKMLK